MAQLELAQFLLCFQSYWLAALHFRRVTYWEGSFVHFATSCVASALQGHRRHTFPCRLRLDMETAVKQWQLPVTLMTKLQSSSAVLILNITARENICKHWHTHQSSLYEDRHDAQMGTVCPNTPCLAGMFPLFASTMFLAPESPCSSVRTKLMWDNGPHGVSESAENDAFWH